MDITTLTKEVTAFLLPFWPYLLKTGEAAAAEAGKRFTVELWDKAKRVWESLRPKVEGKEAARDAVHDAANEPADEDAQAALRNQLKKLLTEDATFAAALAQLWQANKLTPTTIVKNVTATNRGVAIGGSLKGGTIITGDQTTQRGKYNVAVQQAKGLAIGDEAKVENNDDDDDE
jgi:hypothetical protein